MALAINIWCKGNTAYIGYGSLYVKGSHNDSYEAIKKYIESRDSAKDYCEMLFDSIKHSGDGMCVLWDSERDIPNPGILTRRNIHKIHVYIYPVEFNVRGKDNINKRSNVLDMMTWYNRDYIVGRLDQMFSEYLQQKDRTHMTMIYHFHDILYGFEDESVYKPIVSKIKEIEK